VGATAATSATATYATAGHGIIIEHHRCRAAYEYSTLPSLPYSSSPYTLWSLLLFDLCAIYLPYSFNLLFSSMPCYYTHNTSSWRRTLRPTPTSTATFPSLARATNTTSQVSQASTPSRAHGRHHLVRQSRICVSISAVSSSRWTMSRRAIRCAWPCYGYLPRNNTQT
jgi:hypothetical protein